jgi:hypothetical protein
VSKFAAIRYDLMLPEKSGDLCFAFRFSRHHIPSLKTGGLRPRPDLSFKIKSVPFASYDGALVLSPVVLS